MSLHSRASWQLALVYWMTIPRSRHFWLGGGRLPTKIAFVGGFPTLAPPMSKSVVVFSLLFCVLPPSSRMPARGFYIIARGLVARRFDVAVDPRGMRWYCAIAVSRRTGQHQTAPSRRHRPELPGRDMPNNALVRILT